MKKILFILLLLPTVCFAQNDIEEPAEWTPTLIVFIGLLAMISLLAAATILQPTDFDVEKPKQKKDYSYIDQLNKNFYDMSKKPIETTRVNRRTIAANRYEQPLVPYEPNKNTEAFTK